MDKVTILFLYSSLASCIARSQTSVFSPICFILSISNCKYLVGLPNAILFSYLLKNNNFTVFKPFNQLTDT